MGKIPLFSSAASDTPTPPAYNQNAEICDMGHQSVSFTNTGKWQNNLVCHHHSFVRKMDIHQVKHKLKVIPWLILLQLLSV